MIRISKLTLQRETVLFLGFIALGLSATILRTEGTNWPLVFVAATAAVAAAGAREAGPRFAWRLSLALPIAADAFVALLREAQGGSTSGYAPMAILPVAWVGLTLGRRSVAVMVVSTTMLFALPILVVGAPDYPASGWRAVALWSVIASVIGLGANRVIAERRRAEDQLGAVIEIQAGVALAESGHGTPMQMACEGAIALTGATAACIELADGDDVVCSAAAGDATPFLGLRLEASETLTGECFRTGRVLVCSDSQDDDHAHRAACRRVGARSMILVPLLDRAEVLGVLIAWSPEVDAFRVRETQLLALLSNAIGAALGRVSLIAELTRHAVTDDLTGLPNRRAWYEHLDGALARARRSGDPLSVLIIDLDGFKEVNDTLGHAAGDGLLRSLSSRWNAALRSTDRLGRIGGDEFGVVLENASSAGATIAIDRLREATAGYANASIGHAAWDTLETADALIARADLNMYESKDAQRSGPKTDRAVA